MGFRSVVVNEFERPTMRMITSQKSLRNRIYMFFCCWCAVFVIGDDNISLVDVAKTFISFFLLKFMFFNNIYMNHVTRTAKPFNI